MTILYYFLFLVILNIIINKVFVIKKEILFLVIFFLFNPLIFLFSQKIFDLILYYSLSLAYIQTYPALKEEIPTFQIVLEIYYKNSVSNKKNKKFFKKKIQQMLDEKLIFKNGNRFYLSFFGLLIAKLFFTYRKILKLDEGKG